MDYHRKGGEQNRKRQQNYYYFLCVKLFSLPFFYNGCIRCIHKHPRFSFFIIITNRGKYFNQIMKYYIILIILIKKQREIKFSEINIHFSSDRT